METKVEKKVFILMDTDGLSFEEVKKDLIEMHAEDSDDPEHFAEEVSDESVFEHRSFLNECDYDDFCNSILPEILEQGTLIVKLDVGRWDGRYEAMFVIKNKRDSDELLSKFDDYKVTYNKEKHTLDYVLRDHDGTTYGTARLVKDEDCVEVGNTYKELFNLYTNKSFDMTLKEFD